MCVPCAVHEHKLNDDLTCFPLILISFHSSFVLYLVECRWTVMFVAIAAAAAVAALLLSWDVVRCSYANMHETAGLHGFTFLISIFLVAIILLFEILLHMAKWSTAYYIVCVCAGELCVALLRIRRWLHTMCWSWCTRTAHSNRNGEAMNVIESTHERLKVSVCLCV